MFLEGELFKIPKNQLLKMNKIIPVLVLIFISGCAVEPTVSKHGKDGPPTHIPVNVMAIPDAVPKFEKRTRAGNPGKYKILGKHYTVLADSIGYKERGVASWYGKFFHGKKTSNGEIYDMYAMTAAHKTLPIPSYVRVTNLKNQRSVIVRINDRGPFHKKRIIDLSYTAAVKLGIQKTGTGFVEVVSIEPEVTERGDKKFVTKSQKKIPLFTFLQTGAFNNWENAKQLEDKLISGQITKSRIQIIYNKEEGLYKVQVGPLYSTHQTAEMSKKLAYLGFSHARRIVRNN